MVHRRGTVLLFLILCSSLSFSQPIYTQLLCEWVSQPLTSKAVTATAFEVRSLGENVDLLLFSDSDKAAEALTRLRIDRRVRHVQYDWRVSFRKQPDDPLYNSRDNFARAGFEEAWDNTTGGTTPNGVPIVTAILDDGFDADHEDLRESLWRNPGEIPGDGIDNDGNGLIDDVHGWDFSNRSGTFQPSDHGTKVAGITGATGNNGIGVSGGNWRSELILFTTLTVGDIVAAYTYVIDQRKLFNDTDGRSGAFIVATNASFGITGATCVDFPVWGGMYDKLGAVGILTAASTTNTYRDVDVAGDMPADCPSDFLISVTNVDIDDRLDGSAAYGLATIDLGAPGEGSFTTRPGNRYGGFGGTSAAAPYVTSAISLLATTDRPELTTMLLKEPTAAALEIKSALLSTVRPLSALAGRSVSGGIIDVGAAMRRLLDRGTYFDAAAANFIRSVYPNPTLRTATVILSQYDPLGDFDVYLTSVSGRYIGPLPYFAPIGLEPALELHLPDLPQGLYLLTIRQNGKESSYKLAIM